MSSQNDKECHRPCFLQQEHKKSIALPYSSLAHRKTEAFTLQQPQRSSEEPHRVGGRQLVAASASFTTTTLTTVGRLFMTNDMAVTKKGIFAILGRIIKTFITFYRKITKNTFFLCVIMIAILPDFLFGVFTMTNDCF